MIDGEEAGNLKEGVVRGVVWSISIRRWYTTVYHLRMMMDHTYCSDYVYKG